MSRMRRTIAARLKQAQNTAVILTTFNEADMGAVMELRRKHKEGFEQKHGVRLGFTSFFAKACVAALKEFPAVNAEIDGEEIVYKRHYDLGMAVSSPNGLVVPVIRDCDAKSFAQIEKDLGELAGIRCGDVHVSFIRSIRRADEQHSIGRSHRAIGHIVLRYTQFFHHVKDPNLISFVFVV